MTFKCPNPLCGRVVTPAKPPAKCGVYCDGVYGARHPAVWMLKHDDVAAGCVLDDITKRRAA